VSERAVDPDLVDVLDAREEDLLLRLDTAIPGRVQSYDPATQTAYVVPLLRRPVVRSSGEHSFEADPVCPSVPVVWPRVGAWALTMALAPGDTGLLVCCDGDVGTWRSGSGDVVDPVNLQRHHLSHAVFVPGLYRRGGALARAATGTAAVVLGSDTSGARITLRTDGSLEIAQGDAVVARVAADGTVHLGASSAASFVALATLVDARFATLCAYLNTHTHPTPSGASSVPTALLPAVDSVAAAKVKAI
jgi:hypothetical protein